MKKLLLLLLLPITLFCVPAYDAMKELNVNECMNDIFYINDMFMLEEEAEEHTRKLEEITLHEKYNGDKELMNSLANVELLYNYSAKEKFGDTFIAKMFDVIKTDWNGTGDSHNILKKTDS